MCEYPNAWRVRQSVYQSRPKVSLHSAQNFLLYPRAVSLIRRMTVVTGATEVLLLLCIIFGQRVKHFGGRVAKRT